MTHVAPDNSILLLLLCYWQLAKSYFVLVILVQFIGNNFRIC